MSTRLSPDCRDGNHQKCDRLAWNEEADETDYCMCDCGCDGLGQESLV